jgi:hypothetical protein
MAGSTVLPSRTPAVKSPLVAKDMKGRTITDTADHITERAIAESEVDPIGWTGTGVT